MNECCDSEAVPGNARTPCPRCGVSARTVERRTMLHSLRWPLNRNLSAHHFYHCSNSDCELVYFDAEGEHFERGALRTGATDVPLLCYCFGIDEAQGDTAAREFVVEQTRLGVCACDVRNPSGRCCLSAFPQTGEVMETS